MSLDQLPDASRQDLYDHPLYVYLGGEPVSLQGHLERGVMAVLKEVTEQRGLRINDLPRPIELANNPSKLTDN